MSILNDELIDAKANLCWNHQQEQLQGKVEIDCICGQLADMIAITRQEVAKEIERMKHTIVTIEGGINSHSLDECRKTRQEDYDLAQARYAAIARGTK